jgi:hypothetical protein
MLPRLLTLAAALLAALFAYGAARLAAGPWLLWVLTAALGAAAAAAPRHGLLLAAGLAPLGGAVAALAGLRTSWTEPLLLAVIAGWLLRRTIRREPFDLVAAALAGLLAVVVLTSLLVQCGVAFEVAAPDGASLPRALWAWAIYGRTGLRAPVDPEVQAAVRVLCGLGVFLLAVETGRTHTPSAVSALFLLTAGTAAVAALNVMRLAELALRQGTGFVAAILDVHRTMRISSTVPDLNAVSGLFAVVLPSAAAFARPGARWRQMVGIAALVLVAAGLWLSGSRAGMVGGAAGLLGYGAALVHRRWSRARLAVAAVVLALAVAALVHWYPRAATHAATSDAWLIRRHLAVASLRMARDFPLFGVGIGRFLPESSRYAPPELRRYYKVENAHNQTLQVLGELGGVGVGLFLALIGIGLVPARRRAGADAPDPARTPLVFGLCGFLLATLLMHPLLVAEVSAAFWIALGLARAMRGGPLPGSRHARAAIVVSGLAAAAVLAATPARVTATRNAMNLDGVGVGVSLWHTDPGDGRRYRVARGRASVYLDGSQSRVRLPLRAAGRGTGTIDVTLVMDGRPAGRIAVEPGRWTDLTMVLPVPPAGAPRFRRLDLHWVPAARSSRLEIGRETYPRVESGLPGN